MFLGLHGKVVWLTFWSVTAPEVLDSLESIWKRYGGHRKFSMIAAADESADLSEICSVQNGKRWTLPLSRATTATLYKYGVRPELLPLHFLIDDGRIFASSLDFPRNPIGELEKRLRSRLEELDPAGSMRYAHAAGPRTQSGTGVVVGASLR